MAAEPSPLIGNRYQIQDHIGKGGMGAVFLATDRLNGQSVALKRVLIPTSQLRFSTFSKDADLFIALSQEFRLMASLRHPNIISVLDYGFDDERQPYYTMELLDNPQPPILAMMGQSNLAKIHLLIQVLQALSYLHRRGIIHRDLKPGNIL